LRTRISETSKKWARPGNEGEKSEWVPNLLM
jgi:hypothetical protein